MKCSPAVDHVIEHEHAVGDSRSDTAAKDRGVAALRAAYPQSVSFEKFMNRGGDLSVGQQRPKTFTGPVRQRLLDRQPHGPLQAIQLLLQAIELKFRVAEITLHFRRRRLAGGRGGGRALA